MFTAILLGLATMVGCVIGFFWFPQEIFVSSILGFLVGTAARYFFPVCAIIEHTLSSIAD